MNLNTRKNAIVTGGSRGIGRSTCLELAKRNCNIIFIYRSNVEAANEVVKEILDNYDVEVHALKYDVSDLSIMGDLKKDIAQIFKTIDIVINNVGTTGKLQLFLMSNLDQWNDVLKANINPVINLTKIVLPSMIRNKRGRIINITSLGGVTGNPGYSAYATAKAGLYAFTKSLQKELSRFNIICNCVAPGLINTDMTGNLNEGYETKRLENSVLKRKGNPEEVANLVTYLALDAPDYIVGQEILIDGGVRA